MQISSKSNYPHNRTKGLMRQKRKISDVDANEIRRCYIHGHRKFGLKSFAEKYGVSTVAIWKIVREETHVPENWGKRPRCWEPRNAVWNVSCNSNGMDYSEAGLWEMVQQMMKEVEEDMGLSI